MMLIQSLQKEIEQLRGQIVQVEARPTDKKNPSMTKDATTKKATMETWVRTVKKD